MGLPLTSPSTTLATEPHNTGAPGGSAAALLGQCKDSRKEFKRARQINSRLLRDQSSVWEPLFVYIDMCIFMCLGCMCICTHNILVMHVHMCLDNVLNMSISSHSFVNVFRHRFCICSTRMWVTSLAVFLFPAFSVF